jgi:hypothetical protein
MMKRSDAFILFIYLNFPSKAGSTKVFLCYWESWAFYRAHSKISSKSDILIFIEDGIIVKFVMLLLEHRGWSNKHRCLIQRGWHWRGNVHSSNLQLCWVVQLWKDRKPWSLPGLRLAARLWSTGEHWSRSLWEFGYKVSPYFLTANSVKKNLTSFIIIILSL